jgi:hypothetical protein
VLSSGAGVVLSTDQTWVTPETELGSSGVTRRVPVISRKEFLQQFKRDFSPGQHLTEIGPTQRGKSKMGKDLLRQVISPDLKAIVLSGKPTGRERTWSDDTAKELNLKVIETYPPHFDPRDRKKNGYLLRPRHTMRDPQADDVNLQVQFRSAIIANYAKTGKGTITVVDEGHQVQVDLALKKICEAPLMRGAPDNSMWTFVQRGRYVSYLCYDAPEHILIFRDDDRSNQQRYSEISGVDAKEVTELTRRLEMKRNTTGGTISQCLYIRRSGAEMMIVDFD